MLLHLILAVSSVRAFVPYVSTSGGPWVTDVTPGLNWKTASDCGTQFVLNAYYAMAEAHYLGLAAYNSEALFDGPFAQFFGSGWDTSGSATENIWGNINASITYPWKGDRKGRFRPGYQLSVNCKDVVPYTRCSQSGRTVLAYVTAPEGETGPQLSICPVLFNPSLDTSNRRRIPPRRLVDIEKGIPTEELGALFSHGQVMLHEFMHVKIFGHPSGEISDLKALLPSCLNPDEECEVYGHLRCKQFAHPYGPTGVNPKVMQNADNYAWWATAEYFARKWNIRPTKFRAVRDITAADEGDMDTVNVAADDDFVKRVEDIPNPPDVDLAECEIDHADPQKPKMVCDGQGAFEPLPQDFPDPRAMANCPDPNPLLNLGQNPCDTKCNGAGYERCSQDLAPAENAFEDHKIPLIKFSCYCKDTPTQDSPCAGMKCGDPIKMRDGPIQEDGKPQFKAVRAHNGCITHPFAPPSMFACDVFCANGNYKECGKEKFLGHSACACSEGSCADFACVDAIKDYGEGGR